MSSSNCCTLTCIQVSQETGQVVWYSHLFQNFPQFIVIHTVKGFGIINKAEIDVFLELSCFFNDLADVGNLISGSSVQFSSVAQSCPTIYDPMNLSTPGLPVHHQLLKLSQTHVHRVSGAIQPFHPLSPPSPFAYSISQHQHHF